MPIKYTPVDYDPFAPQGGVTYTPVDYDPFAPLPISPDQVNDGGYARAKALQAQQNITTGDGAPDFGPATSPQQMQAAFAQASEHNRKEADAFGREIPRATASGLGGLMQFGVNMARTANDANPFGRLPYLSDFNESLLQAAESGPQAVQKQVAEERQADKDAGLTTPISRIAGGVTEGLFQLPEYLLPEGRLGRWGAAAVKAAPAATNAAIERYKQLVKQGLSPEEAAKAAAVTGIATEAGGILPMGMSGNILTRAATSAPVGVAQYEATRRAENAVLPESMQQPFDPEAATVAGVSSSMLGTAFGHPAVNEGVRLADEIIKSAGVDETPKPKPVLPAESPKPVESVATTEPTVPPRKENTPTSFPDPAQTRLEEIQAQQRKTLKDQSEQEILSQTVQSAPNFFPGDVEAMRASLKEAGLPQGSVVMKDGSPVGLRFGKSVSEKVRPILENKSVPEQTGVPVEEMPNVEAHTPSVDAPVGLDTADAGANSRLGTAESPGTGISGESEQAETQAPAKPIDYTQRFNDLRSRRNTLTDPEKSELHDLYETDRVTAKMGGKPMVGVKNRVAYEEELAQGKLKPAQVFTDADNFKQINDKLNHDVGDNVLRDLGDAYKEAFGEGNVYHFGGDEFVPQADTPEQAHAAMEQVRAKMAAKSYRAFDNDNNVIGQRDGIGISYGVGKDKTEAEHEQYLDKKRRAEAGLRTERATDLGRVVEGTDGQPQAGPESGADRGGGQEEPKLSRGAQSGSTVEGARKAAEKAWGRDAIHRLTTRGGLEFTTVADAVSRKLGGHESPEALADVKGFYDPKTGKAHVLADNIAPENVAGVVLHEAFHANAEKFLGSERFQSLKKAVASLKDKAVKDAYAKVPEGTPEAHRDEEAMAYLAESAPNHPFSKKLVDQAKLFLNKMGVPLNWLNAHDAAVREIAAQNLRHATESPVSPRVTQDSPVPKNGTGEPLYSQHTPEQKEALAKAGMPTEKPSRLEGVKEELEKLKAIAHGDGAQAVFDRFHGIKMAEDKAREQIGPIAPEQDGYLAARLSTGSGSSTEHLIRFGGLKWEDGVLAPDEGVKGLLDSLEPVRGRVNDFLGWMVGRRAERLKAEGRENNLSDQDIQALKSLAGPDQAKFEQAAKDYAALNKSALDVAEQAGTIDPVTRSVWENADYVPFFRDLGDEKSGPGTTSGLSGQKGVKQLKGGSSKLKDPLENIVQNFHSLIDGAMKNEAMRRVIDNTMDIGVVQDETMDHAPATVPMSQVKKVLRDRGVTDQQLKSLPPDVFDGVQRMLSIVPPKDPDVVRVMEEGKPKYYRVLDPQLLRSVSAFATPQRSFGRKLIVFAKSMLTHGTTVAPDFMARNWMRDTLHSYIINPHQMMPGIGAMKGVLQAAFRDPSYRRLMAAGALFGHGRFDAASREYTAKNIRTALRAKGWGSKDIGDYMHSLVDTPAKLWELWHQMGAAAENANRIATYESTLKNTGSRAKAAYDAKDLLDFTMQGDSLFVKALADAVPFYNARMQGLYKLYRAGVLPGSKFKAIVAMKGVALMALSTAYIHSILSDKDKKEKYDALEDWDKDNNWHFWFGGKHRRIPKPFEVGILYGTTAEHLYRTMVGQEKVGKAVEALGADLWSTLQQNPTPQLVRPAFDALRNKDTFTGRPIENESDEGKLPWDRFDVGERPTSPIMRKLSEVTGKAVTASVQSTSPTNSAVGMSPKQMEYLWDQYTGALGQYALGIADTMVKIGQSKEPVSTGKAISSTLGLSAAPGEPAQRDLPALGWFVKDDDNTAYTRYQTELYDAMKYAKQLQGSLKSYQESEDSEDYKKADQFERDNQAMLGLREPLGRLKQELGASRKQIKEIATSNDTPEEKRRKIDELMRERNDLTKGFYYQDFKPAVSQKKEGK